MSKVQEILKKIAEDDEYKKGSLSDFDVHGSTHSKTADDMRADKGKEKEKDPVKYTEEFKTWIETVYAKDIKAGTAIETIQADVGVQEAFQKSSGQSPIIAVK